MRVAMCQVRTKQWALGENLERTLKALEEASAKGAELAITPECVLHGYAEKCPDFRERMLEVAEPVDGESMAGVCSKAKELGISVVVGFAERAEGEVIHNSAALISKEGDVVQVYRKVHCRSFEDISGGGMFSPGGSFAVTDLHYGGGVCKLGTMICFDREVAETVRCLRSLGAEIVACPLATDTADMSGLRDRADNEMITRCRAAENEVFIVVANHAGRFNGGSFAVGPRGELLHQMGPEEGVHVLDIPVGMVREEYHSKPLGWMGWGYRRQEVYNKYLR